MISNFLVRQLNAILTIALRDFIKLLRDKPRVLTSFIFPVFFLGGLGGGLQASLGNKLNFDFLTFIFTGVFAQTLFQSTASGITFLIQDRENDFSQEMFVSPISRYSIILGKILGESLVAFVQVVGVVIFGLIIGAKVDLAQFLSLIPAGIIACLLGGAFGTLVLSNLSNIRSAQQVFPFLIFPQIFLSGVFNPIKDVPLPLHIISRLIPMTYAVDFLRGIFYLNRPEYNQVVLYSPLVDLLIITALFTVMLFLGTYLFIKNERNR